MRTIIHHMFGPVLVGPFRWKGKRRAACSVMVEFKQTDDWGERTCEQVTCKNCKRTQDFKEHFRLYKQILNASIAADSPTAPS